MFKALYLTQEGKATRAELRDMDETALAAGDVDVRVEWSTLNFKDALAVTRDATISVPVAPVERVVDATGAGDLFASGFLFGLARGREARDCLHLGALAASEVIGHVGARSEVNLGDLARQNGLM